MKVTMYQDDLECVADSTQVPVLEEAGWSTEKSAEKAEKKEEKTTSDKKKTIKRKSLRKKSTE